MRIAARLLACAGLLAAFELASFAARASLPALGAPADSPCGSAHWKGMSLQDLAKHATRTAQAGGPQEWDPCALTQLRERGSASVPVFIELIKNPLTRGEAMFSLLGMGSQAAPAVRAIEQVIDEDQGAATYGIRILTVIGITTPEQVVPALIRYSSSVPEETAISAIVALHNLGRTAVSAIDSLVTIALSDTIPPSLAVKNAAADTAVRLGEFEPDKIGPYLIRLAQRVELAPGICEGVQFMGVAAKPWASALQPDFDAALLIAKKREEEINDSKESAELYRELMRTRESAWCIKQALAILSDSNVSPK